MKLRGSEQDVELMAGLVAKDERALGALIDLYGEQVFRFALRLTRQITIAEEVANDVFLEVWSAAADFRGDSALPTWLLGITRFKASNAVRGKKLALVGDENLDGVEDGLYDVEAEVQAQERQQLLKVLRAALQKLSVEHREVLELTFFHERSCKQIARIVGAPEATVRSRMHYARTKLREALQGFDVERWRDLTAQK
ncbi:MAG: sigma-70 family RNA polymerase sigma factor [bacterium]